MNLFLIGSMGAGKTTLGKALAATLNLEFCDSDDFIVQTHAQSIAQIFAESGESAFRALESQALQMLTAKSNILLATGGGAPLMPQNRALLKENGFVVYLKLQPQTLFSRIQNDGTRPLLNVENPLQTLESLYQTRDPIYTETAHFVLNADDLPLESAQNKIISAYENFKTAHPARAACGL